MSFKEQIKNTFDTRKIGIVEFCESSEFCGKALYPRQAVLLKLIFLEEMTGWEEDVVSEWLSEDGETFLCPKIRERRDWLRDNGYTHFPEVVLVGGRRSSKGFVSALAMGKIMYNAWKLGDPGAHYGIDSDKEIYFTCVASSLDQARKYQFSDLVSVVTRCKPFIDSPSGLGKIIEMSFALHTPADKRYVAELKRANIKIDRNFAKIRGNPLAANADTIRGSATMGIIFDEMAFMENTEGNRSSAEECYNAAEPSLTQFRGDGIIFCNSSPWNKLGKIYDRYIDSFKLTPDDVPEFPALMSLQFPTWELYKDYERDPLKRFKNAVMHTPDCDIEAIPNEYDKRVARALRDAERANPEKFKVERRAQWAEVTNSYLDPERINDAFSGKGPDGKRIVMRKMGTYVHQPYVMHCDPSSTTAGFGFAVGHAEEFDVEGVKEIHVVIDYLKRWNPQDYHNHTIDYMEVMKELALLCDLFRPRSLTFDQWNSVAPIQWLQKELSSKRISVMVSEVTATHQKNWNRWELCKTAFNLGLVHIPQDCPDSQYAAQELKFLHVKNGSVEKQNVGPVTTKDIADCVAEVTRVLMADIIGGPNEIGGASFGAQRGYPIGGAHPMREAISTISDYYRQTSNVNPRASTRGIDHRTRGRRH